MPLLGLVVVSLAVALRPKIFDDETVIEVDTFARFVDIAVAGFIFGGAGPSSEYDGLLFDL